MAYFAAYCATDFSSANRLSSGRFILRFDEREIPREQAVIFALRLKYGTLYTPPPATGTLFADMTNPGFYATSWAEQAYKDGLIPSCGMSGYRGRVALYEVMPMLPEILSAEVCSLKEGEDRAALVCHLRISDKGKLESWRMLPKPPESTHLVPDAIGR